MTVKKKVFSGVLFDIYQREQEQFDGSIKTFELADRVNSALVIPTVGDQILVAYQTQPSKDYRYYGFVGGMVPRGVEESAQAREELLEETGMSSDDRSLWKIYTASTKLDRQTHIYVARDCQRIAEPHLDPGGEKIEVRAVSFDEFVDLICTDQLPLTHMRADLLQMKFDGTLDQFRDFIFHG
ncbi:MAG: NUDIX domain-containing protein [Candidatus Peribacteria bacterium]|nr:MAG: NUDIX domain-containing protein [Candidatus Peribacteria bacterium]